MGVKTNLLGSTVPRNVAGYLERLRSSRGGDRRDGAQGLARLVERGELGAEQARKWLSPLLDDADPYVVLAAAVALCTIDPLTEARHLRDCLRAALDRPPDSLTLCAAVRAFVQMADEELVASLRDTAESAAHEGQGSPRVEPAAWILAELGAAGDGSVIRTLVSVLSDAKVSNRAAAAWALGRSSRPEALESLRRILVDGNHLLVDRALRGLGDADTPVLVDRLLDALRYDGEAILLERLRSLPCRFLRRLVK